MTVKLSTEERWKAIGENASIPGYPTEYLLKNKHWPVYVEGHGIYLRDSEGKDYIDATSGAFCCTLGQGNKKVVQAIKEQLDKLQFTLPGHTDVGLKLCEKIAEVTPGDLNHVVLGCHGSDANEAALTIARQYFKNLGKPNSIIVSQWHSYHGQTLDAASTTGITNMKTFHGRDVASVNNGTYHIAAPYCYRCDFEMEYPKCGIYCAKALEIFAKNVGPENVVGFMVEPVLVNCGSVTPPPEYFPMIRQICDKYGILLIDDEVITGWGRTGKLFALNNWNIVPDIMAMAKGLTGAYLPMSATVYTDRIQEAFKGKSVPYFGHTHSFYPAGAACALASIDVTMEEKLWENAAKIGAQTKSRMEKICQESEIIGTVHGIGLALGFEIVEDKKSKKPSRKLAGDIQRKCEENGVMLFWRQEPSMLPVAPALIINSKEADQLCDVLAQSIKEVERERRK